MYVAQVAAVEKLRDGQSSDSQTFGTIEHLRKATHSFSREIPDEPVVPNA